MNLLFLLLWFAVCADQDARRRKVSNALTFGAGLFALLYLLGTGHAWLGASMEQAWWALALTLILTLPGYALGRLGAGDVKLMMAVALASDTWHVLGTFIGAGVVSVIWLWGRHRVWRHLGQRLRHRYPNLSPQATGKQPFVPMLWIGFVATAIWLR